MKTAQFDTDYWPDYGRADLLAAIEKKIADLLAEYQGTFIDPFVPDNWLNRVSFLASAYINFGGDQAQLVRKFNSRFFWISAKPTEGL